MKVYQVEVEEVLQRIIRVKAKNEDEAIDIITRRYKDGDIVLDSEDFIDYDIHMIED